MGKTSKSRTSKRKMKSKRHNMTSKKNSRKSVTRRRRMKGGRRDYFGNTMRTFQNGNAFQKLKNRARKASNTVRSRVKDITNSETFQTLKETRPSRSIKSMRNRIGSKLEGAKQKFEELYSSQGDEQDGVRKIEACTCPPNLKG